VALVTGGSKGIGAAIAQALAAAGASVAATSRSGGGPTASNLIQIKADVRRPEDAERAVQETVKAFGGLDILVNNAGVGAFVNVADMSIEQWQQVIDTNLSGVFYYCHAAIPELRKRGGGWIINISSLAGKNAFPQGAAYCASKAGLNHFSEALMQEVRYDGIRVSYIMPGSVSTEFMGRGTAKGDWATTSEDVAQVVLDLLAMPARSLPSRIELRPSQPPRK
jgi:NAD(P)-dependent dehydrogenase (short-subunit alcohol dehydrogenase family)